MKPYYLLLLLFTASLTGLAQTSLKEADIDAASGNGYETLLCNVGPGFPYMSIEGFLQLKLRMTEKKHHTPKVNGHFSYNGASCTYIPKIRTGKEKEVQLHYKFYAKPPQKGYPHGIVKKVVIWGNWHYVARFFLEYWSRKVSLGDVSPGEIASRRFLTDVATISYLKDGTGKIVVVNAKDR